MKERPKLNLRSRSGAESDTNTIPVTRSDRTPRKQSEQNRVSSGSIKLGLRKSSGASGTASQSRHATAASTKLSMPQSSGPRKIELTNTLPSRKPNSREKQMRIGAGGLAIIAIVVAAFLFISQDSSSDLKGDSVAVQGSSTRASAIETNVFKDESSNLTFGYNQNLVQEPLSDDDIQDGFLVRFTSQSPPVVVSVRQETGLRAVSALSQSTTTTLLKGNIERSLPTRFPNYAEISNNPITDDIPEALLVKTFTYTGPSGEEAQQILVVLLKDEDTAMYISLQTTATMYDTAFVEYFEPIIASVELS